MACVPLLEVGKDGTVSELAFKTSTQARHKAIADRYEVVQSKPLVMTWRAAFVKDSLFDGEKYLGRASGQMAAVAALEKVRTSSVPSDVVAAMDDFVIHFCGFHEANVKGIVNAVHFFFRVDVEKVVAASLPALSEPLSESSKAFFDMASVAGGEMLLRTVVERPSGQLAVNAFSPGLPMAFLQKLPMFAQMMMVLGSAVDAISYQTQMPGLPLSINVYAGLLHDDAPVLDMLQGIEVVEVMEMTRGAQRGRAVQFWVTELRARGIRVLLDDFTVAHPGLESSPDGIKVSAFQNAAHTLQVFKAGNLFDSMVSRASPKSPPDNATLMDYYGSLIPKAMPDIVRLVMEGSENCMKTDLQPGQSGPPLNFAEPRATTASAYVYKAAAMAVKAAENPSFEMFQQGGRALYETENFDDVANSMVQACGKPMDAARREAGTIAWLGSLAPYRAAMKTRSLVCGIVPQKDLDEEQRALCPAAGV